MKAISTLLVQLINLVMRLLRPGGTRSVIAENLLLRHQLAVLNRNRKRAPNLRSSDQVALGLISQCINPHRLRSVAIIVQPATILKFHRALVRRKYQRLFNAKNRNKPGPSGPSKELIEAIVEIKQRNPRFGSPRIADIITLTFGIPINKDVVRRVLAKHYKPQPRHPGGPSWLTFIGHCRDSLWSVDLFRCESLTLNSYWILVVMDQFSRSIVGFGIHRGNVDGIALCQMFNQASSGKDPPHYISTDNDPLFQFHRWQANLRVLEAEEIKSVPFTPISHPFVERLIGTIRREYLDLVPFWNSLDLQQKLNLYKDFYNEHRTHSSLDGLPPGKYGRSTTNLTADLANFSWKSHCNGLFQTPIPA